MNIITNNCIGGFIYKEILNEPYKNPFIWTFISTDDFLFLCDNYKNINFNEYELYKTNEQMLNNFFIKIDNKINIKFTHYWFDKNCNIPTIKNSQFGIDIHYNKIWEYIIEKYNKRTNRMLNENKIIYIFFDDRIGNQITQLNKFIQICEKNKTFGLLITYQDITNNSDYVKIFKSNINWNKEYGGWHNTLMKNYGLDIKTYLEKL